jgi:methanethiol S-methyltransferase
MGENPSMQRPAAERLHYLAFGFAAYLASLMSMVYFGFFLADLIVPKSVDSGPSGPAGRSLLVDLVLVLSFGLVHSLMARPAFKAQLARFFPPGLERSLYSLVAALQIALICWGWQPLSEPVWDLETTLPVLGLGVWILQGLGWAIVVASLATIDSGHLFGLHQARSAARGSIYAAPPLEVRGIYRRVRHPIYTGSLIAFWSAPTMSQGRALLVGVLTIYLLIGMVFEERQLERELGEAYRRHKRLVPALFPRLLK